RGERGALNRCALGYRTSAGAPRVAARATSVATAPVPRGATAETARGLPVSAAVAPGRGCRTDDGPARSVDCCRLLAFPRPPAEPERAASPARVGGWCRGNRQTLAWSEPGPGHPVVGAHALRGCTRQRGAGRARRPAPLCGGDALVPSRRQAE